MKLAPILFLIFSFSITLNSCSSQYKNSDFAGKWKMIEFLGGTNFDHDYRYEFTDTLFTFFHLEEIMDQGTFKIKNSELCMMVSHHTKGRVEACFKIVEKTNKSFHIILHAEELKEPNSIRCVKID